MIKHVLVYRLDTITYIPLGEVTYAITDSGGTSFVDRVPEGAVEGIPSDDNKGKTPTAVRVIVEVVASIASNLGL